MLTPRAGVKFSWPHSANGSHVTEAEFTEDAILGGRVILRQPARGYRVNVDTILLAASLPGSGLGGARVVEPGCGVGGALVAVASSCAGDVRFVGIEKNSAYAALARENVVRNGVSERVKIIEGDALDAAAAYGVFDRVLINPPYDHEGEGRAPAANKRAAFIAERPLGDWIKVWCNCMAAHASLTLIQRTRRLGEILAALEGRLGGVEVFPIRPNASSPARRIIVRAWKGSKAPLRLYPGLDLHPEGDGNAKYTPEAEAILRGEAHLRFG
jgi:tRNA1(Val) A37 N6-methylase TrmN6